MNTQLVESLAQIIDTLTDEEKSLLEEKVKQTRLKDQNKRPFYETATPKEWIQAFETWAERHPGNTPFLSDEAISRESIYGERG